MLKLFTCLSIILSFTTSFSTPISVPEFGFILTNGNIFQLSKDHSRLVIANPSGLIFIITQTRKNRKYHLEVYDRGALTEKGRIQVQRGAVLDIANGWTYPDSMYADYMGSHVAFKAGKWLTVDSNGNKRFSRYPIPKKVTWD